MYVPAVPTTDYSLGEFTLNVWKGLKARDPGAGM